MRLAIIDRDNCQPRKCALECIKFCPGVRMGDETVVIDKKSGKPAISEELCTGCGICTKKCPFDAIFIVNLPEELKSDMIHTFGENAFRLFRLPYPQEKSVTGIIGQNGIGKTTIVKILSGDLIPNFGELGGGSKEQVIEYFSGVQFHDYFTQLYDGNMKAIHKPQYVDHLPKVVKGEVRSLLEKADEKGNLEEIIKDLELEHTIDRSIDEISGGELQRVAIAATILRDGDIYILDEPSSYLDVRQRLKVAGIIRDLAREKRVLVVEHDLIVLDYLADYINMMYGRVRSYGIVSHPSTVRQGINVYLGGYMRDENVKFRAEAMKFEVRPPSVAWEGETLLKFTDIHKSYEHFDLEVKGGEIRKGEVLGILGPNATGKTTFVKVLAGEEVPEKGEMDKDVLVSYKPQYIKSSSDRTVFELLSKVTDLSSGFYTSEISKPFELDELLGRQIAELSGGELQKVAIAECLGRDADIYLLDEPSAYLDVEQRLSTAKTIRRIMEKRKATGIIVDHDILFIDYISDRLMVFEGEPGVKGASRSIRGMREGMNAFLKDVNVTFRRDPESGRPRANKPNSQKDKAQKSKGEYYYG
ncbi:ribosome biogenesis/translation initiation ATPase RLI [archaeon]|nr:ribosome biogenesis/translation initiation ATPase RLI [archaeon]